jgi:hypothetical protein
MGVEATPKVQNSNKNTPFHSPYPQHTRLHFTVKFHPEIFLQIDIIALTIWVLNIHFSKLCIHLSSSCLRFFRSVQCDLELLRDGYPFGECFQTPTTATFLF